jgi:hypothetical protein
VNGKEDERMKEGDRSFLSKFAIDPEMDDILIWRISRLIG